MRNAMLVGVGLVAIISTQSNAQTVVMDFQATTIGPAPASYTEDGILQEAVTFSPSDSTFFNLGNPSPGYALNSAAGHVEWSLLSGDPFNFVSVDLNTQTDPHTVHFTVNYFDGAIATFPILRPGGRIHRSREHRAGCSIQRGRDVHR